MFILQEYRNNKCVLYKNIEKKCIVQEYRKNTFELNKNKCVFYKNIGRINLYCTRVKKE